MDELTPEEIRECLQYIRDVFPYRDVFDYLVENGARDDEVHQITGDNLAGACWHLDSLMRHFGVA